MSTNEGNSQSWQEGMTQEEKEGVFEELFMHEVEAWFSSDIACCDDCHDRFLEEWPYAADAEDAKFQNNSVDLDLLYSASKLSGWYSKDEYEELLRSLRCPNCFQPLTYNIWPYELPFEAPENYDSIMAEIAHCISHTPFFLLDHPFCKLVRDAIADLAKDIPTTSSDNVLFRGRSLNATSAPTIVDFDFPPPEYVKEGRYNHAGDPVLYLACSEKTCRAEMRDAANLFIASFRLATPIKILDLTNPQDLGNGHANTLSFIVFSTLLSAKSKDKGFSRPEYVFSRFIKDCAKASGFDAIRYPSTRVGSALFNLVIINQDIKLTQWATHFSIQSPEEQKNQSNACRETLNEKS